MQKERCRLDRFGSLGLDEQGLPIIPDTGGIFMTATSFGMNEPRSDVAFKHITDGLSKTFLVGEKHVVPSRFGESDETVEIGDTSIYDGDHLQNHVRAGGNNVPPAPRIDYGEPCAEQRDECDWQLMFGSNHPGSTQFGMCDGSVHTVSISIDLETYRRLAVRNDELAVDMSGL